jgi:hypothetical protein
MHVNQFSTMVEALAHLQSQGFSHGFLCTDQGLQCLETKQLLQPEDLTIVCYHRFEGAKDLGDVSVIYAVEAGLDLRGVIVDAYGPYADGQLAEYLRRMQVAEKDNN